MNKYYNLLGVNQNQSLESINKAWRQLAFKYHPDRNNGDDAHFKLINEAWDKIKNNHSNKEEVKDSTEKKKKVYKSVVEHIVYVNLFDLFNGLFYENKVKIGNREINLVIREFPRCINFGLKIFGDKDLDGEIHLVKLDYKLISTSTNTVSIEIGENGLDLIVKVLVKTDDIIIFSPLNNITIKNEFPYTNVIKNKGLYKHTEDGTLCGDLIIDNSINFKEEVGSENIEFVEKKEDLKENDKFSFNINFLWKRWFLIGFILGIIFNIVIQRFN